MHTLHPVKRLSILFLAVTFLASCGAPELVDQEAVNPTAFQAASMPACGTGLASFDGDTAYSNGGNTGSGVSCAGTGVYGYQYQCVELVMRHFTRKWGLRWYGNAKDLLTNAPRASVDVITNGDGAHPPVAGDMLVWTNGTYGHVALITGVRSGSIDIIEQNVSGNGKATLGYDGRSVGVRWGSWVPAGWAHAKANHGGGVAWDCGKSTYMGHQYWTCSGSDIYRCDDAGNPQVTRCPSGCVSKPTGTDDTCK